MPNYDLSKLGNEEFERLCQSLIKEIIGLGTTTFGDGKDGGREATFTGSAPYPSLTERWCGEWIFQVKYHNLQLIGVAKARRQVLTDIEHELEKITKKYKRKSIPTPNSGRWAGSGQADSNSCAGTAGN